HSFRYSACICLLPSFPTRRSSDLVAGRMRGLCGTSLISPPECQMSWQSSTNLGTSQAGVQHDRGQDTLPTKAYCGIPRVALTPAGKVRVTVRFRVRSTAPKQPIEVLTPLNEAMNLPRWPEPQ